MDTFQRVLRELRLAFLADMPERCEQIERLLLELETKPGAREPYEEVFRCVHSLKGSGGTHGLMAVSHICHELENVLLEVARTGPSDAHMSLALSCVDLLRALVPRALKGDDQFDDLLAVLEQCKHTRSDGLQHVLVADASRMMTRLYAKALERKTTRVSAAHDGLTALQCLVRDPCDLLIIGLELPELNGLAVVSALQAANTSSSRVPVVLVTSQVIQVPTHLTITRVLPRDNQLLSNLEQLPLF